MLTWSVYELLRDTASAEQAGHPPAALAEACCRPLAISKRPTHTGTSPLSCQLLLTRQQAATVARTSKASETLAT